MSKDSLFTLSGNDIEINTSSTLFKNALKVLDKDDKDTLKNMDTIINMSKRRIFHKGIELFLNDMNKIVNAAPEIAVTFLMLKAYIDEEYFDDYKPTGYTEESGNIILINHLVDELALNEEVLEFTRDVIYKSYNITIESNDKDNHLQFTDDYAKSILQVAMLLRLVIPLIAHYMFKQNVKRDDNLFLEVVGRLFKHFNNEDKKNPIDLGMKIQKFVETAVLRTSYSDQVIWRYLANKAENEKTVAIEIQRNLICYIIPKLQPNKSIVSFFHVVIRNQLDFQFTSKFKVEYKPISTLRIDSESSSNPFSRLEQKLVKSNSEIYNQMYKEDIADFISNNEDNIDEVELEYYMENLVCHTGQHKLLTFFIHRNIGRIPAFSMSKIQYVKMCLIARDWFKSKKFPFLAYILLAKPVPRKKQNKNFRKGKTLNEIVSSKLFAQIHEQYKFISPSVEDSAALRFIGEIMCTDFESYILWDGTEYVPEANVDYKSAVVELMKFLAYI